MKANVWLSLLLPPPLVPNSRIVSLRSSPSDGVAFNNSFQDILVPDSAFDFGHRRSCDPSYHDKHFRIERNLVNGGNNKVIGMSHPSNGVSLINNLFFSSPGYAYHAWWKMRMMHNSRLWVTTDEVTPWYPEKIEQRRQMTSWEIGNHPDITSCPNDVDASGNALSEAEKAQKSLSSAVKNLEDEMTLTNKELSVIEEELEARYMLLEEEAAAYDEDEYESFKKEIEPDIKAARGQYMAAKKDLTEQLRREDVSTEEADRYYATHSKWKNE